MWRNEQTAVRSLALSRSRAVDLTPIYRGIAQVKPDALFPIFDVHFFLCYFFACWMRRDIRKCWGTSRWKTPTRRRKWNT